jgi:tetratricopeptide (TPR) repeat protein
MGKVLHFTISIPAALVAAAVALSALTLRLPSRLVALYYQEQGARALARALLAEGRAGEGGLWLEPEPLTRPDAQALAAQALERFQAAIAADPANFQAHRWLGRAALLLDRPGDAVAAFSAAVRLRPDNPLGWWELGLAYDHLAPPMPFSWGDRPEEEGPASAGELSQPALIDRTSSPPRGIPAVGVEAPAVESSAGAPLPVWGYARWPLPDAPGGWPGWWVPDEPVPRTVLFAAVPATVTFQVSLPVTPTALVFWMGMDPALQAPQGDGVVYRVWVEDREVFSHTLRPQDARAGWWPAQADLTPWAGRTVRLTLALDPGPAGDTNGDWAGWGDVQLVEAARAGGVLAGAERRAVAAWRAGGISAQQLVEAGEEARKAKRYEEALEWYGRASALGLNTDSTQWYVAFQASRNWDALEKSILVDCGWVSEEMRFRAWLQWGSYLHEQQRNIEAEEVLNKAIAECPDSPAFSHLLSEMYRILGLSQAGQGKIDEAVSSLRKAVELNDQSTWAHIHYGKILYLSDPNLAPQTDREFDIALEQDSRIEIWRNLIEFWRWVGDSERAHRLCERANGIGLSGELTKECPAP